MPARRSRHQYIAAATDFTLGNEALRDVCYLMQAGHVVSADHRLTRDRAKGRLGLRRLADPAQFYYSSIRGKCRGGRRGCDDIGPRPGSGLLPTALVSRRRTHLSTTRAAILDVLIEQSGPCTVPALAELTRRHPMTIRQHLDGLLRDRLIVRTRAEAQGPGRPAWLYGAAPDAGSEPGPWWYAVLTPTLACQIASYHPDQPETAD